MNNLAASFLFFLFSLLLLIFLIHLFSSEFFHKYWHWLSGICTVIHISVCTLSLSRLFSVSVSWAINYVCIIWSNTMGTFISAHFNLQIISLSLSSAIFHLNSNRKFFSLRFFFFLYSNAYGNWIEKRSLWFQCCKKFKRKKRKKNVQSIWLHVSKKTLFRAFFPLLDSILARTQT